jgi:hypothetical protein
MVFPFERMFLRLASLVFPRQDENMTSRDDFIFITPAESRLVFLRFVRCALPIFASSIRKAGSVAPFSNIIELAPNARVVSESEHTHM